MQPLQTYFQSLHLGIAVESILSNKLRSFLSTLGIVFGVAAVISILAIGKGAQIEILEQIKMVGVNNITITPTVAKNNDQDNNSANSEDIIKKQKEKYSPGLNLYDVESIKQNLPSLKLISPVVIVTNFLINYGVRQKATMLGVSNNYFGIYNLKLEKGTNFSKIQETDGSAVCIIGKNVESKFFPQSNAIGQYIKFDKFWFKIIGVLEYNNVKIAENESNKINVINEDIFVPVSTVLIRIQNRGLIKITDFPSGVQSQNQFNNQGAVVIKNYHQLDRIVVQVKNTEDIAPTVDVLNRMFYRRHNDVNDFVVAVPELLLKQQKRTKEIFNMVLGAIASISLIVGGIGIMNIMFATVMERIKEIGIRMAIGANRRDIIFQFLSEAMLISIIGGIIGVIVGIVTSQLISHFTQVITVISPFSVVVAFFISASVGVFFGYLPARRAAERTPIESLRYE